MREGALKSVYTGADLKKMSICIVLALLICVVAPFSQLYAQETPLPEGHYDLLIRGGDVVDGTGAAAYRADLLIRGEQIAFIGVVPAGSVEADRIIDATGRVVTPGFIDAHTHGDPFSTPDFENFLAMGVTTICIGQDGSSPGGNNVDEWMSRVENLDLGLNIVLLVGHGTVRRLAGVGLNREPTEDQLELMADLVEDAMAAGCFGLSTGLEYQPGSFAGMEELVAIARPVGNYRGLVMSHMRSEDDDKIERSLEELISQGEGGECAIHVSHIKVVYGHGRDRAEQILAKMREAEDRGVRVTADIYPYNASYTGIGIIFPDWAKPPNDYAEVVRQRREELADYLRNRVRIRNGPESTLFATSPWTGKTLAEISDEKGKPFEDVLIEDIGPFGASAAYFVMDAGLQERLLVDPLVMISTDGSPEMHHPRGYGAFARLIREYVVERKLLNLEEAVYKMSGLTAATLGLDQQGRGILREGCAADVLVFDPGNVIDRATYEEPHRLAQGFDLVVVNGRIVREYGILTGERSGRMLRHRIQEPSW